MSDLSPVAQIMTSAVGLMGALVAGLSVYFTYKGRHNQFRQVVYGRQMDAYFDITESMSNLFTAAQNIFALSNPRLKGEGTGARLRSALREEHERFTATVNRSCSSRNAERRRAPVPSPLSRGLLRAKMFWAAVNRFDIDSVMSK